jgi:hypothetical protein
VQHDAQMTFAQSILAGEPAALALFAGDADRIALGLRVHANNAMHALVTALRDSFPQLANRLGDAVFTGLAVAYARAHPPRRGALIAAFGAALPDFVEDAANLADADVLADLARTEWAWLQALHAPDATPLPLAALAALSPEALAGARLRLHPSLTLVPGRADIALIRDGDTVREVDIPADLAPALRALLAGESFAGAQASAADADAFITMLVRLIEAGALTDILV